MLFQRLPFDVYNVTNAIGAVANILCVVALVCLAWRKHAQAGTATAWPTIFPGEYLKKEERHKFNPIWFIICFGIAYAVLLSTLRATTTLLSPVNITGSLTFLTGSTAFASGVLFFIPVFLLLAIIFPGNGKPTRQLELVFPAFALQHMFNRLACFMGNCCFGVPFGLGVVFPEGSAAVFAYGHGTRLFPNQLIEAAIMLLCFGLILWLQHRGKRTLPIFPLVFGATGFLLGFATSNSWDILRPLFGFTNATAFTHLIILIIGVAFLVMQVIQSTRKKRKA